MAMRALYRGCLEVNGSDHTRRIEQDGDWVDVPIDDVDARVTSRSVLTFTLDYPFEEPFHGEVRADGGVTLRQIIDAIRAAFRGMYADTSVEPIAKLDNKRVRGAYGEAFHVIDDLVIESIELDDETGELQLFIGS